MPSDEVAIPSRFARARPSDARSMPIIAASRNGPSLRLILIIKSVPMLPDPMIATGNSCELTTFLLMDY